ncbi:MAG: mechanosensitive ion channel family protein [Opitutales bacterium]|jgi:small conductance mechanosensitive channel|nr:mechanosensitive ion channel family protein [Opitutales bacterium]MDP4643607.1 mechanosensitive ion channel family protein [Opitutales bacterium]MDP4693323.1 mechanosensitive ion channel family protein [Opitutales bacterium]MDP4778311.1 mechanosensitive ion channel family protein [Opitutales bacterium]MDP4884620.1 mechanosensitive ion channel family protein [Opitutales bacterium]
MEEELQQLEELKNKLILYFVENGMRLLMAILILVIGFWVAKRVANLILNICKKKELDPTLARFFAGFSKIVIIVFALIMALSKANIEITPFIALLGASAFGLSLAVQGPISNYGAGIVLIVTRPFVVGDTLTLNDLCGTVDSVNLGNTQLINEDEERITIPNRKVLGEIFTNSYEHKIVEAVVGIDYSADPENAIECITTAIQKVEGIATKRAPDVGIEDFGDSSINIGYRVWVPTNAYHRTRYKINMAVFRALEEAQITIPFPQRDVHLIQK